MTQVSFIIHNQYRRNSPAYLRWKKQLDALHSDDLYSVRKIASEAKRELERNGQQMILSLKKAQ